MGEAVQRSDGIQPLEGDMEPSWSFPIAQAMQQHRGSQTRKPAPAPSNEATLVPADRAPPAVVGAPGEAAREGRELVWG